MKLDLVLLMAGCVLFNSAAHVIMKYSTRVTGLLGRNINPFGSPHVPLLFLGGAASFAVSIVFYLLVLKTARLSIAFSVLTSLNYVIIILYSVFFFNDRLSLLQYAGLVLIFLGLFFLLYDYSGAEERLPAERSVYRSSR